LFFSSFHLAIVQGNAESQASEFKEENGKGHEYINNFGKKGPPAMGWFKRRVSLLEVLPIRRGQTGRLGSNIHEIAIPLAAIGFVMLSDSKPSYKSEGLEGCWGCCFLESSSVGVGDADATIIVAALGLDRNALDFFFPIVSDIPEGIGPVFLVSPSPLGQQHVFVLSLVDQKGHPVNVRPGVLVATAVRQGAPLEARAKSRFDVREDGLRVRQDVSRNLADLKVPALDATFLFKDLGVHVRPVREIPNEFLVVIVE